MQQVFDKVNKAANLNNFQWSSLKQNSKSKADQVMYLVNSAAENSYRICMQFRRRATIACRTTVSSV